jgi:excisionase family DNA binding protein
MELLQKGFISETIEQFYGWVNFGHDLFEQVISHERPAECVSDEFARIVFRTEISAHKFGFGDAPKPYKKYRLDDTRALFKRLRRLIQERMDVSPAEISDDQQFTVAQVAERLNLSNQTVYRLADAGKLRATRHGTGRGRLRISASNLREYMLNRRQEAKSNAGQVTLEQLRSA